jgi:catechol 2,3-dioxygenase-like lactoylglutathione lyase family enzyme
MSAQFNHTIVHASDQERSARFLADMLGRPAPGRFGPFSVVELDNGVSLDFISTDQEIASRHFAFLVDDATFDSGMAQLEALALPYWADPATEHEGEINHNDGGRGVYFRDPDGHFLEMITTPYGVPKT